MIKKRLMKLLKGSGKYIAQNVFWQWLALVFQIGAVLSAGVLIQQLYEGNLKMEVAVLCAGIAAASVFVRFFSEKQAAVASYKASADVKRILRQVIYEKLLRLGASYKEAVPTSEVVQVSVEGVEQLEIYYGKYLPQLFYSLLAPVTLFAALSRISLNACLILLVCVPLIPVSIVAVQKFAKRLLGKYWNSYTSLGDRFLENLQGLTTLKIYQADELKSKEMDEEAELFRKITMKVLTMQLNSVSVMDLVAYGGAAVGMIVTVLEFQAGQVSMAGAFTIILLASEFFIPLRLLGSFFHIAMNGMSASDKIFRILDIEEPEHGTEQIAGEQAEVVLSHVGFSYEAERRVLQDVSIRLPAGSFTALAGVSGCGKSTVASLLTGRLRGFQGNIMVNGIPVEHISGESLMSRITLVRHNSWIFRGTVKENLLLGNPEATDEQMEEALRQVNLYDFLFCQNGLETKLEEQGNNLSGGQRQRLALARALLSDSAMYIFDEASSNIDAESEKKIMEVIHAMAGKKTILLISHRLANVECADQIYMMENGRIAERGNHRELMNQKGSYARMYIQQMMLCGELDKERERKEA